MKSMIYGAVLIAAAGGCVGAAFAATPPVTPRLEAPDWVILPGEAACRSELELTGRSGAVSPVTLVSDGGQVSLRFAMEEVPERAFLPIRVDQKAYANLVLRSETPKVALMVLSDETLAAMRKGGTLQIAWLSDEAVRVSLAGGAQALADLRTCGAQVSAQHRANLAAQEEVRVRAAQEVRAKALADEQLAAVRAQTAAVRAQAAVAEAERQRLRAEADRIQAQADQQRAVNQRRRSYAGYDYEEDEPRPQWGPPRALYTYRPYDPRYDQ